jgi:2-hydroxy-6-oxonona-2,4-dienedioate hydrolase
MPVTGLCSRWVQLPSGVRAHYVTAGEGGPDVVLLHGGIVGSSGTAGWWLTAPFLAAHGFRVHCPDLPSFGLTEDPAGAYRPGQVGHLEFLHDFVRAICLDRFHVAGNSMGCVNAVNYVVGHPDRVRSFVLIAGLIGDLAPRDRLIEMAPPKPSGAPRPAFDGTAESMRRMLAGIVNSPDKLPDDLVAMRTHAANRQQAAWARHSAATYALDESDAACLRTAGRLDRLTVPGIYLYGRDDTSYPVSWGFAQEDVLPNVQFFYPERCGHQGQTDRPELFNTVMLEFFRNGRVSRQTAEMAGVSDRRPVLEHLVEAA